MKALEQVHSSIFHIVLLSVIHYQHNWVTWKGTNKGDFPGSSVDKLVNWKLSVLIHLPTKTVAWAMSITDNNYWWKSKGWTCFLKTGTSLILGEIWQAWFHWDFLCGMGWVKFLGGKFSSRDGLLQIGFVTLIFTGAYLRGYQTSNKGHCRAIWLLIKSYAWTV